MTRNSDRARPSRRNPPVHTRFKPGQSGNPKGRPKGRKNLKTVIDRELAKRIKLTEDGKSRLVTKQEVVVQRLVHDAIKGQHRATDPLLRLVRDVCGADEPDDTAQVQISQPDKETLRRIKARLDRLLSDEG